MSARGASLVLGLILLAVGLFGCGGGGGSGSIDWHIDWREALERAQAENKPIMINFYTDICPACRQLDLNTYTDDELSAFLNANFVNLRSNAGKSNLYARYGISSVPTIIFSGPDGYDQAYEIRRFVGYKSPDQFYEEAAAALEKWQP